MSILSKLDLSWDGVCSCLSELSLTTKLIIGGTSLLLLLRWITNRHGANMPPGPIGLPLLGNLLSMRNKAMETLISEWQQKYGPVFTVSFGTTQMVVMTDIDLINEALVKQGSDFSGRPYMVSFDALTEGSKDIAAAQYGELWKFQRKIALQALRQYLSGDQFEERVHSVVQAFVEDMEKQTGPVDLVIHINLTVFNVLHGLCFGKTFGLNDQFFRHLIDVFDSVQDKASEGFMEDVFPLLRYWPTKKYREALQEIDYFNDYLHKEMDRHRTDFDEGAMTCLADNIVQAEKLSHSEGQHAGLELTHTHTAQTIGDVFGAGVDTTRTTLSWLFLLLAKFPDIQRRMQEEIDSVVGNETPGRKHRSKLVYTEAVIFETMRLLPAAPFAIPHQTLRDTNIGGYRIPKKTSIFLSLMSVLRDPKHWEDPLTFKPERFLNETQTKIEMRHKSFTPFSMGHRSCPGEGLAKLQMLYIVVGILQKFSVSPPPGETMELDTQIKGLFFRPPSFKVVVKQR